MTTGPLPIRRALLSVGDKRALVELAEGLAGLGVELVATHGTWVAMMTASVDTVALRGLPGTPTLLGGRIKTLHPALHAALAARGDEPAAQGGLGRFDLVVACPPDLAVAVRRPDATLALVMDHVDGGGVTLVRAAAANPGEVAVVVDPADYPAVLDELRATGALSAPTRLRLAARAFALTATHDALVAAFLTDVDARAVLPATADQVVPRPRLPGLLTGPWQRAPRALTDDAALYRAPPAALDLDEPVVTVVDATVHGGRPLAATAVRDLDRALALVRDLPAPAGALARGDAPLWAASGLPADEVAIEAARALATLDDGGAGAVVVLDHPLSHAAAAALAARPLAAVLVPAVDDAAVAAWPRSGPALLVGRGRWHEGPWGSTALPALAWCSLAGGLAVQERDEVAIVPPLAARVSARAPSDDEQAALGLAARVVRHVPGHALVVAGPRTTTLVVGAQPDLARAIVVAAAVAGPALVGGAAAVAEPVEQPADLEALAACGVRALLEPGGSPQVLALCAAADRVDLALVQTGVPHGRR